VSFFSDIMDVLAGIMTVFLNYCYDFTHMIGFPSYGIAIILLTIVIKAVLAPLTAKQIRSMERMQKVQPKVKELQQKYKGNSQKMNAALQKLYKEEKVNPLAGCLPLIIQMPFLISIFYALRAYPYDPTYESFLWMPSLGQADPTYIMPILSAISTFAIQKQMSGTQISMNEAQAKQQKIMSIVMPLFIGWISLSFPSGLVIYWVVSNVFQWVQQFVMFRMGREKGAQA
jgi:YidC/Oxa1 family membrane protein insertase